MRRLSILIVIASVSLLASCEKDYPPVVQEDKFLEDVLETSFFETSNDFKSYISNVLSDNVGPIASSILFDIFYKGDFENLIDLMYLAQDEPVNPCRLELYTFSYRSIDALGQPITLTGTAMFPNIASDEDHFVIDAITLYNSNWSNLSSCISSKGSPLFLRTLFNQMVVIPDYQGFGRTQENVFAPTLCYHALAQQAIDCEMAAIELLKMVGGEMKEGYGTYNMGLGRGASVAMATQKLIENSSNAKVKETVNLMHTYCCGGTYDNKELLNYYRENQVNPEFVVSAIQNTFYANNGLLYNYNLSDFFSDEYNFGEADLHSVAEIMNPSFFRLSGAFNYDDPMSNLFFKAMGLENTVVGWVPRAPIFIEHSRMDEKAPYELFATSYDMLAYNGGALNHNVSENTYNFLCHDSLLAVGVIRMLTQKNPSINDCLKIQLIKDEENI